MGSCVPVAGWAVTQLSELTCCVTVGCLLEMQPLHSQFPAASADALLAPGQETAGWAWEVTGATVGSLRPAVSAPLPWPAGPPSPLTFPISHLQGKCPSLCRPALAQEQAGLALGLGPASCLSAANLPALHAVAGSLPVSAWTGKSP